MTGAHLAGVVLAAGAGRRLRPLTELRPKALCPVGGVPLVDLALQRLVPHTGNGPVSLAVNAHHHAERLAGHVGPRAHVSREEPAALGTAGALGALRDWLDGRDVLLTNADAWLPDGLAGLVDGWDGQRCRLLAVPGGGAGDFRVPGGPDGADRPVRYVGACLLPWRLVRDLAPRPAGLFEVLWRGQDAAGRLDVHVTAAPAIDCGTPVDYLRANLAASGGASVIGAGAEVRGVVERSVVWDGAWVGEHERLVDAVRAGDRRHPVTVRAAA